MNETILPRHSGHLTKQYRTRFHHLSWQSHFSIELYYMAADAVDPSESGEKICRDGRYTDIAYSHWSPVRSGSFSDGIHRKLHDIEIWA